MAAQAAIHASLPEHTGGECGSPVPNFMQERMLRLAWMLAFASMTEIGERG
jgi:hypothetical protein